MKQSLIQLGLFLGIVIFLNILGNVFYTHFDLTEEKRYSLTDPTRDLLENLDNQVYIRILLEGEFPAGFKRLQKATHEMLDEFRSISGYVDYEFDDPNAGSVKDINARRKALAEVGIEPINLRIKGTEGKREVLIYPYAIFYYKGRELKVNLLENDVPGVPPEIILNNSIGLLEYKFSNAIQKMEYERKTPIVFLQGHGELQPLQVKDLTETMRSYYNFGMYNLDTAIQINPKIAAVIIAKPKGTFSREDKFKIDQYVMYGGKVIWLIDRLDVHLDSLRSKRYYVPYDYELDIDDLLFKYGCRIQPNLVLDWNCTPIELVIDNKNNVDRFPWHYHIVSPPASAHPIVKSLDNVNLTFASSIDTIQTKTNIKKTRLLTSSERSMVKFSPMRLSFDVLRFDLDPKKFNKPPQTLALLLEGKFSSLYENRIPENFAQALEQMGTPFKTKSEPNKMLVVADGDIIKNPIDPFNEQYRPLGYNRYAGHQFANKDFLINAIEYMLDDKGIIESRSREVKLRLLNTAKAKLEKTKWQFLNTVMPLVFLVLFGLVYNFIRKRRFA